MRATAKPASLPPAIAPAAIGHAPGLAEGLGVFLLVAAVALAWQGVRGALTASFGDDEASHYVSSLLMHDYVHALARGGAPSPRAYLGWFHSHYPLVGIGHWPPFHYLVVTVWMLLAGTGRPAVLVLSAAVTAAVAAILYAVVARRCGRLGGAIAAVAFAATPLVRDATGELMLDVPVALWCLLAMLAYARFLDRGRARDGVLFAVAAVAAVLTKGTGLCLALLPVLALLISRRAELLRRPGFWLPVPIVGALAGPWYLLTYNLVAPGFRYHWGLDFVGVAVVENLRVLLVAVGPLVLAAGLAGVVRAVVARSDGLAQAAASLLLAVLAFQSIVPAALEARYLAPALPPLLFLAMWVIGDAAAWIAARWRWPAGRVAAAALLLVAASMLGSLGTLGPKRDFALTAAARQIWAARRDANPAVLIAGDGALETAAIAELAMADPGRPSLFAVRGSRLLGGGGYNNQDYQPRFADAAQVMAAIDDYAIPLVLLRDDASPTAWAHVRQLSQAIAEQPGRWQTLAAAGPLRLLRVIGNDNRTADQARLLALSAPKALAGPP